MNRWQVAHDEAETHHPIHAVPLNSIVEVEWVDSERIFLGWATVEDYTKALADRTTYRTAGYLVNLTGEYALIVMNRSDSGMVGEGMVIPLICIQSVTVLQSIRDQLARQLAYAVAEGKDIEAASLRREIAELGPAS